jgi:hypothetical protein
VQWSTNKLINVLVIDTYPYNLVVQLITYIVEENVLIDPGVGLHMTSLVVAKSLRNVVSMAHVHMSHISQTIRTHVTYITPYIRTHVTYITPYIRTHVTYITPYIRTHVTYITPYIRTNVTYITPDKTRHIYHTEPGTQS